MDTIALTFNGRFNDAVTGRLAALMDDALAGERLGRAACLRLRALMVEQVQNVGRYSADGGRGRLEIGQEGGALFVRTTNPVDRQSRGTIAAGLAALSPDPGVARRRFRQALREPAPGQGAGLGLLFLSLHSSRGLDWRFLPEGDRGTCFQLTSYL